MIRVLHSVSNMDRAGIETMLMNYYRYMDKDKIQFDFLCNKSKVGAYDEEIRQMGGRLFVTPGLNPIKYTNYLKFMSELFKQNNEYRIVEAHNGALGVYALYAAKKNNIPIRIFHAHGASIAKDWKLPIKLICKSLLPFNMNEHFTCGTEAARCYFGDEIVRRNEFRFVPNAIEVERFIFNQDIREKLRNEYKLQNKHIVGHIGRFMNQKNHSFLIDVFEKIAEKDDQAVLVLLGDGELQEAIKKKVEDKKLSEKVCFIGNVGNANEWYNVFDVFVLPSVWEGLPVVGIEAQANDLQCVFSSTITKEVEITDNVEFISLKESLESWANIIISKFDIKMRNDNTQLITDNNYNIKYEAKKLQDKYIELYEEIK